jgi:protoheme IX farnesyltransferase
MPATFGNQVRAFVELGKFRLATLVVVTAVLTYFVGAQGNHVWLQVLLLAVGGFAVTGASNAINQILEMQYDALMKRTMQRPLPTHRLSKRQATVFAAVLAVGGLLIIGFGLNWFAAGLSALALLSYAFAYTPLKRVSPFAVWVGAVPGALPVVIGYVAATGAIDLRAALLFAVQFVWQFPHFWAIAWVSHQDYTRAGYRLLPSPAGKDFWTVLQIALYAALLVPTALLPYVYGFAGWGYAAAATVAGLLFTAQAVWLLARHTQPDSNTLARRVMFGSFIYLPVVFIAFYLDKI